MKKYTLKELCHILDRSSAALYLYFKEDEDFFSAHKEKRSKGGFLYDEEVLEHLKKRIGVEDGAAYPNTKDATAAEPETEAPPEKEEVSALKLQLEGRIEELLNEKEELQARLEKVESEREELLRQNGQLLLLLGQEKAEKQLLLKAPPPTRHFRERVKNFFKGKQERNDTK